MDPLSLWDSPDLAVRCENTRLKPVVRSRNESPDVIELVNPTHHTRMQGGAVISWFVVHPEPGYTYSSRWGDE